MTISLCRRLPKEKGRHTYPIFSLDKNLGREDQLLKLRTEVENLDGQFKLGKLEFEEKERLQHEAFNVSLCSC